MKIAANFVVSLAALGTLLGGTAAQAVTNLAELPLKAAVLAKPNIVYGIDDSGSMDWELLLSTASGILWWNNTAHPGWDSATGKPRFTGSGAETYTYLFPIGTIINANPVGDAPGGNIYGSNDGYYRALPPTAQFAWVRSAAFNPQYYDPGIEYKHWAPAYHDGALKNYADVTPSAAKIHPSEPGAPVLDLTQEWNATSAGSKWTKAGYRFVLKAGMTVPAGSRLKASTATSGACSGSERDITADLAVASGGCEASIPYFPATYWHAEVCTVNGVDCVNAPNGTTLKRYEIKTGQTFPSGRAYAAELQNFANWFTYYRKRKLSLAGSMGAVLETLTGVRMGSMLFTNAAKGSPPSIVMYDADAIAPSSNRLRTLGDFYRLSPDAAGTPTHKTMQVIGDQFNSNTGIVQYACQRNAMFIVTDGFANTPSGVTVPSYSQSTFGAAAPQATTHSGTLADLGLAYYTKRLRASGGSALTAGRVPPSTAAGPNPDTNIDLHVNTYGISLGVEGSIWPGLTDPFLNPPTWPTPVADTPGMLDDLWHATINGRGKMFLANNPTSTVAGMRAAINDVLNQVGAQGGVAVSTVNLQRGDSRAYFGTYNPAGWTGDLTANAINPATGDVSATATWSAGAQLLARAWGTRVIASFDGSSGVPFTAGSVGTLVNPGNAWGVSSEVMDYLRGDRSFEGSKFRTRTSLLGAVINAEPVIARDDGVAYFASGEGMLHAIDTRTNPGEELWAFVPRAVLADIGQTTARGYTFKTQLDGSPVIGKTGSSSKLLVGGMGAAGRGYYAIDVSSPRGLNETQLAAKVKWEFPDATNLAKVGQTVGRPAIVRVPGGSYKVLVTSGYNDAQNDGRGRLWILDPATGGVEHTFEANAGGSDAGLAHVSPFIENDGTVRYVYGGDLRGNVWKFDLVAKTTPALVAVLKDGAGNLQPVTAAPELISYNGKRIILVGTGRLLDITDFGQSTPRQSFYAIADGATLANARSALVQQTYNKATDTITSVTVDWTNASTRGWFIDLPTPEQANTRASVSRGLVSFVTNVAGQTDCTASSYLYVLDVLGGTRYTGATFVGTPISTTAMSAGVNLLLTSGSPPPACNGPTCPPPPPAGGTPCQHLVGSGQDADGKSWKRQVTQCVTITPSKNAWREVRR